MTGINTGTRVEGGNKIKEVTNLMALVDVIPQLDGELAICQGDMIEITEIVNSDWIYGHLGLKEGFVLAMCGAVK